MGMFKIFRLRGGIHPDYRKESTAPRAIQTLRVGPRLYLPLTQHVGAPALPVIKAGQRVLKGQLLARAQGNISAPLHAPTSGLIAGIAEHPAPHPSGLPGPTVVLEPDGLEEWVRRHVPDNPLDLPAEAIAARVAAAGIVGMGGAAFPAAVKLDLRLRHPIQTLLINGAECEPYLSCDDRLMRERAEEMVLGIRLMLKALEAPRALVAIEDNKTEALAVMTAATVGVENIRVVRVPTRYPMGSDKHLVKALTGREPPAGARIASVGVLVHNVATAHAIYRALYEDRPLISRVVTVAGQAVARPGNYEVPLGLPVAELLAAAGGLTAEVARLVSGGPMMGQMLLNDRVPVIKGTSGILAFTQAEIQARDPQPCIRCGRCVGACPQGLLPLEMASRARNGDLEGAEAVGLQDCISCGACAYVCPSAIPLTQTFQFAKGALTAVRRDKARTEETRELAAARLLRQEEEKRRKAEAAAQRKAEAARKKAQAARKATEAEQPAEKRPEVTS